jgi:hypothetical protein
MDCLRAKPGLTQRVGYPNDGLKVHCFDVSYLLWAITRLTHMCAVTPLADISGAILAWTRGSGPNASIGLEKLCSPRLPGGDRSGQVVQVKDPSILRW